MARYFNGNLARGTKASRSECISYTLDADGNRTNVRTIVRAANAPRKRTASVQTVKVRAISHAEKRRMIDSALMSKIGHQNYESGE